VKKQEDQSRRRPDIVFVIGSLDVGGAERHLFQITPELRRRGWQVEIYCMACRGPLADALEKEGVAVLTPSIVSKGGATFVRRIRRLIAATWGLFAHLRSTRAPMVHFFLPESYMVGGVCALFARTPVRIMSRRSLNDYQKGRPLARWLERALHRTIQQALGNSQAVVEQLRWEGIPASRLELIYNGINLTELPAQRGRLEMRTALGVEPATLVFVMVANLIPYKGHRDALAAFALAQPRLPERWVVLMAGRDDGIGSSLRAEAAALGLGDHVKWLGARNDVPDLLGASDVGLLCSHQEGFSNAILEAMGAGLPMVATDVGGNAEAVVDGMTGFIVPAHGPARLAEALVASAEPERRQTMGRAARRRIEAQFLLSHCVDQYERCYQRLWKARGLEREAKERKGEAI